MNHRKERLNSLIREELAKIIMKELEFENALVTITEVETSDDLEVAVVNFSVLPSEKNEEVLKQLDKSRSYLRSFLMKKIKMRGCPQIRFKIDTGSENAAKVEKLLLDDKMDK